MLFRVGKLWLAPLVTSFIFLYLLLEMLPYATGYGWVKISLGYLTWQMWQISDWEYAAFVPLICIGLVYLQWGKISQAPIKSDPWGGALILFGVLVYCLGLKAETQYIGFVAVEILVAGLILWFWGRPVFGLVSFAWLFSFFTWPLPFLDGMVALPLRLIMSHGSYVLLNLLGTPCFQNGTAILSAPDPHVGAALGQIFQIDIADPCSGLHSLFALMMISALASYLAVKNVLWRWAIFLSSVPLAIAGNMVRIIFLVWGTKYFGAAFALGTEEEPSAFHMACGYAVYLVALSLLLALISLINAEPWRKWGKTPMQPTPLGEDSSARVG